MPVYNAAKYLNAAIDSILRQTFKDIEFLIIDDDSTDNSVAIIQSYNDGRIRFYQNEKNIGISATLNKGIQLSNTELIARMDADDISYPERIQKQYDYMQDNTDCALVSCQVKVITEDGEFVRQDNFKNEYYYYNLTFICWIYHPTVMYRKMAVDQVGMYTAAYSEDFELFWQLYQKYKIYNLSEILMDYRITSQSLHQVLKKKEYEEAQQQQILRNIRFYAGENYTVSPEVIDCLQHNFQPLLSKKNVSMIVACLTQLNIITEFILAKKNINRDLTAIKKAAFYKRKFIVTYFVRNLPPYKAIHLLLRISEYKTLTKYVRSSLKK